VALAEGVTQAEAAFSLVALVGEVIFDGAEDCDESDRDESDQAAEDSY
jgi:hypothetical protein